MATSSEWVAGARPRTLPAAATPVMVGSGAAAQIDAFHLGAALLALVVAVALQVGVNYANDYSDGVRGTDADRVGPLRLTGSGAAQASQVKTAAFAAFGVGALAGLALVVITGHWWLLAVGVLSIAAAWYYTGGKNPYGYRGLGEVGVFVFFGLVAVLGTTYTQADQITVPAVLGAVAVGLLACAILMVNNIRDIPQDRAAGKRTLAVVVGDPVARALYASFLLLPFLILVYFGFLYFHAPYVYFTLLTAVPAAVIGVTGKTPKELILALQLASLTALLYGLALAAVLFA